MAGAGYGAIEPYLARHGLAQGFGFEEPIYLIEPSWDIEERYCPRADTWSIATFPSGEPWAPAVRLERLVCGVIWHASACTSNVTIFTGSPPAPRGFARHHYPGRSPGLRNITESNVQGAMIPDDISPPSRLGGKHPPDKPLDLWV